MKNLRTFRVEIVAILAIVIMQVGLYLALRSFISMGRGLVIGKVTEVSKEEHRQSEIIATIIERQTMNRASILETNRLVKELIYATTQSASTDGLRHQ